MTLSSGSDPGCQERVARVLEEELQRVQTPEMAEAVVEHVERLTAGQTEAQRAEAGAERPGSAAETIERAAAAPSPDTAVARVLEQAAEQTVAPTPDAPSVASAAETTLTPDARVTPAAERGRRLLKEATLRRMDPLTALDARLYLAINELPHPGWVDSLAWAVAMTTVGGWIWVIGTLIAYLLRVPNSWTAFKRLVPSVLGATWLVELAVKASFRRRRPFVRIVQALVIGKKPGSWSFPSGHTASSFASAWVLSTIWPRRAPFFFLLAGLVGFDRVYVGAHYPGDVISGAFFGTLFSEIIRRAISRLF
ncbi:MAG: phosphatase PAP2 family protein [Chloroflexi bacterium]|nr:phosphatase PAP2 family protein [Chloroflexota bacterium]